MDPEPTLAAMPLKVPANLPSLVKTAFDEARAGGHLTFFPSRVALLSPNSVPFQLRFSPALASKPKHPHPHSPDRADAPTQASRNPFAQPDPHLLVGTLDGHNLVLNKFAVVPEHFILATREFRPQTHFLEESDLAATYACVDAYRAVAEESDGRGELFAFFNSGPHSGASQPHRHIQMLPVERMRDGLDEDERDKWQVLADRLGDGGGGGGSGDGDGDGDGADLSFVTFHAPISRFATPRQLHETYLSLLRRAALAVEAFRDHGSAAAADDPGDEPPTTGEAPISYNVGMTARSLVVCPRLSEGAVLVRPAREGGGEEQGGEQGEGGLDVVGTMALNGTVLAGTALVKNEGEWDALRADEGALRRMLAGIGVPKA